MDLPNGRSLDVAVKKISSAFKNAEEGKRLLREIKLMKHFNHENVNFLKQFPAQITTKQHSFYAFSFIKDYRIDRNIETKDIRAV